MKLNFGAGHKPLDGYINLDKEQCDLNTMPLLYDRQSIAEIHCSHVLEHLDRKPSEVMAEFLRILEPEGTITIRVPHFSWHSAYDEDHERFFTYNSLSPFHENNLEKDVYQTTKRKVKIKFFKRYYFWNYLIEPLVNINSHTALLWESTVLCRLFPAQELQFEIKKVFHNPLVDEDGYYERRRRNKAA